jgi:hypothetical protein
MIGLNKGMSNFERAFLKVLREDMELLGEDEEPCRGTIRTDKLGNRVAIPYGGTMQTGSNGRGVPIPKGFTATEDDVGQMHAIPPGKILKIGRNGHGVVICPGESTSEKSGQIVINHKKTKNESRRLSCLELLQRTKFLVEG